MLGIFPSCISDKIVAEDLFSTLFKLKSVFNSANVLPANPVLVNIAISLAVTVVEFIRTAFVFEIPKVSEFCLVDKSDVVAIPASAKV